MHYDGVIYRPPFEAKSLLLQVTAGCSHNACRFCSMYRDVPYRVSPMEEVLADLREAQMYERHIHRVFLEGGDAFSLSGEKLIEIAEAIHTHLHHVEKIAMYASIKNIRTKSDEELRRLAELGVGDLNIGLESGDDEALEYMNKGYTSEEALEQLQRLRDAGMTYGLNLIFGMSGKENRMRAARKTAELVNRADPYLIFVGTLHSSEGCPLYEDMRDGSFVQSTVRELIEEERVFLERLELTDCIYFGLHPSNVVRMHGNLPQDKERLLAHIDQTEMSIPARSIDQTPTRAGEGGVVF